MAAILISTMMLLVRADSRMPRTSTTVSSSTMRNAGMSKPAVPAGCVDVVAGEVLQTLRQIGRREPLRIKVDAEPVEQVDNVRREAHRDAHVGEGIFEDEVPADDPRDQLAHGRVGVGVGRAGDGNHAGQLRIAEPGEARRRSPPAPAKSPAPGPRPAARRPLRGMVQQMRSMIGDSVQSASFAGLPPMAVPMTVKMPEPMTDADAQRSQRHRPQRLLQRVFRPLRFGDQLVDGFGGEDLPGQRDRS